jgi:hypothetical protein
LAAVKANYPMDRACWSETSSSNPGSTPIRALKKKRYSFTVNYNKSFTEAYIVSEPLGIPARDTVLRIDIRKGLRDAPGREAPPPPRGFPCCSRE